MTHSLLRIMRKKFEKFTSELTKERVLEFLRAFKENTIACLYVTAIICYLIAFTWAVLVYAIMAVTWAHDNMTTRQITATITTMVFMVIAGMVVIKSWNDSGRRQ